MIHEPISLSRKKLLNVGFIVCIFFVMVTPFISRVLFHSPGTPLSVSVQFLALFSALWIQVCSGKVRKGFLIFVATFAGAIVLMMNA